MDANAGCEPPEGFEPHVGELHALRTFRIGPGGVLYPLFGKEAWTDGGNAALCRLPLEHDVGHEPGHLVPEPGCTCGFYAFATEQAAGEYPHARHVLAVVACWGRIIAGRRGLRAEFGRIEAVWMSETVPTELASAVALNYPMAMMYSARSEMLDAHRVSDLDCFESRPESGTPGTRRRLAVLALGAVVAGAVPAHFWWTQWDLRTGWALLAAVFVLAAIRGGGAGVEGVLRQQQRVVCVAVALWLLAAPVALEGWLFLRLPLLLVAGLICVQRHQELAVAQRFPADVGAT